MPEAILRFLCGEDFFLGCLRSIFLSVEKKFFGQQILLPENVVKGPAQNKFGPAYWYHLFLVTKNIIKVDLMKNSVSVRGMNYQEQHKCAGDELSGTAQNTSVTSDQNSLVALLVEL